MNVFPNLRRAAGILALVLLVGACSTTQTTVDSYQSQKAEKLSAVKAGEFDNGRMWTFDYPPVEHIQHTYGFTPDDQWLKHARLGALRFATWCSASFVSADGLVMTNHHCSRNPLEQVSKEGEDLLTNGFVAKNMDEERPTPNLFVDQLVQITDVTDEIIAAENAGTTNEERIKAREEKIKEIQEANTDAEKNLRCQVVSFYDGGKYSAYVYKRYGDVRLVLAPEIVIGHYGGEHDNFTYPRYALDFTFWRVYDESGKPMDTEYYFKWSAKGAQENDAVFVLGNPGSTSRLSTVEQLKYMRDVSYPFISRIINDRLDVLHDYQDLKPEKKTQIRTTILQMENARKAYWGRLNGLRDDMLFQRRVAFEGDFKGAVQSDPAKASKYGKLWNAIAQDRMLARKIAPEVYGLRVSGLGTSNYLQSAYNAMKYRQEASKSEAGTDEDAEAKINKMATFIGADMDMERLTLTHQLEIMRDYLGNDDPVVMAALNGKSPEAAAKAMLSSTAMKDSASYYALVTGTGSGNDPFFQVAELLQPRLDAAVKTTQEISVRDNTNEAQLGRAFFAVYGTDVPPDATFTLRIADGVVKGYEYNGTIAPPHTTFYGMYDRHYSHNGAPGWELPERWKNPPDGFDMSTPVDFVSTNDIIGGNSGSPIVNKDLEIVGLVFDGNVESLPGDIIFAEDAGNRTISVHSAGILEAVRYIYDCERIARELEAGGIPDGMSMAE